RGLQRRGVPLPPGSRTRPVSPVESTVRARAHRTGEKRIAGGRADGAGREREGLCGARQRAARDRRARLVPRATRRGRHPDPSRRSAARRRVACDARSHHRRAPVASAGVRCRAPLASALTTAGSAGVVTPVNGHALARKDLRPIIDRSESHPVNEAIFRSILGREWKRADRSETTFLLLLVAISEDSSPAILRDVVGSLSATKRRTDLLGWYRQGRVVGLILPDAGSHRAARRAIEKRLRGELDPRTLARVSITLHAYPAPLDNGSGVSGIDTLLTALRSDRLRPMTTFAKRALDIVGSAALLIALSPLLLAIAAIVKMTSAGPVLFRQTRIGGEGRPFTMLKFRTMFANADQALHRAYVSSFINGNGAKHGEGSNSVFKLAHDPRIRPIGRLLRKTSLDEVPQFINVLRGEMSLVGPRPP